MSNQWAMGYRFWAEDEFEPPTNGEAYLGGDYQQYLTSDNPGNFVGFDVVEQEVLWRVVSPAPLLGRRRGHLQRPRVHRRHARLLHGHRRP